MSDAIANLRRDLSTAIAEVAQLKESLRITNAEVEHRLEKILEAARQIIAKTEKIMPVEKCDTKGDLQQAIAHPKTPDQAFSVLYIEDNPMSLGLIQQIFARWPNIKLFSTDTGRSALSLAKQYQPGLILLDLNLPDMHGGEVLRCLREDKMTKGIPVVVISADSAPSEIERLLAAGARNYVTKPFDLTRFVYIIDEIAADHARGSSAVAPLP